MEDFFLKVFNTKASLISYCSMFLTAVKEQHVYRNSNFIPVAIQCDSEDGAVYGSPFLPGKEKKNISNDKIYYIYMLGMSTVNC